MKKALIVFLLVAAPAAAQTSLLGDVAAERSKYGPSMSPDQVASLLNTVAWNHRAEGWGLLRKGAGNSCPIAGTFVSCDILIHRPSMLHFDVLTDAENTARPQWNVVGPCVLGPSSGCDMANFLDPVAPAGSVPPVVVPPVVVPPIQTDLTPIHGWIDAAVASAVQTLYAQEERTHAARIAEHAEEMAKLDQIERKPSAAGQFFGSRYTQIIMAVLAALGTNEVVR